MKIVSRSRKGASALGLVLLLLFSCAGFASLKMMTDRITRKKIPGASIIYLPSGKYLKYATLGYSSLAADLIYIWAIQYYSTPTIVDRFQNLFHIFSIIAELDPRFTDAYEVGALIAAYEDKNLELAYRVLDLGLEKNPDQWYFPFLAGHYAQLAKDYESARKYYEKAMKIEGAPEIVKRLYAASSFRIMDLKTAWETWLEVFNAAQEERIKKIASNHLYQVKAAMDIQMIEEGLARYKARFGHLPPALQELARMGIIPAVPQDMDGRDYVYNPRTGEVKAPTIWWKRS
jgi:tetratricopeptide (TPR) repeat protein